MINKEILHYRIEEKLGQGGMGVVYKAQDTKLQRAVAIKFLPEDVGFESEDRERFSIEAQAAAALNHPNIATIHAIEETEEQTFIVMEYINGEELRAWTREAPVQLSDALNIASQIAEALQAAHDKGIVHRDIKSSNIMVTESGLVKIMDFGLAKLAGASGLTKTGITAGTIAYMSPEQIQAREVDHRSDLWSFGVLLYEMLTGDLPFCGDYEAAIIYSILNQEPTAVQAYRSDVPEHIVSLLFSLLRKNPMDRIPTARDVLERLRGRQSEPQQNDKKKTVAVLYFENMSSEEDNEYVCAGMTEDLITDLSRIHGLKVIPRSDVLPFRNKEVNSQQVGETLRVNYVVEGSVRKVGNRIRITAQLVDVKSGFQLWAERYDRLAEDIFDIQSEVSERIAEALKVSLTTSERRSVAKKPTDDLRAYDFYMRGGEFLSRRGQKNNDAAIQMFEHALSIDPDFSLAYAGLAEAYSFNYIFFGGDRVWLDRMMEMNERALSIDPELIEARLGIAMVYMYQRRFVEARRSFEDVIRTKSDFYPANYWLGLMSYFIGDDDAAIKCFKVCVSIKPYSEEPWELLRIVHSVRGEEDPASEAESRVIELGEKRIEVDPNVITLSRLACTYAKRGAQRKAEDAIKRAMEMDPHDGFALYNCSCAHVHLGNKREALEYLKAALNSGVMNLIDWVRDYPDLEPIREEPEFKKMIAECQM